MPYFYEYQKIKLPRNKDRRRSITDKERREVLHLFRAGVAIREITRQIKHSRRAIQFIIYPDRLEKVKRAAKDRGQSARSYAKVRGKKWAATIREHRRYKYKVLKKVIHSLPIVLCYLI